MWATYRSALEGRDDGASAAGLTREKWLLLLFRELGYGRVAATPSGGLQAGGHAFPVSHLWERVPLHLLGWGVSLDRRSKGVAGAADRAPHAMVQELLNRSNDYLWAVVTNGQVLRLLRDSTSLSGQAYVEFDLEAMFDGEVFSDFALLFLLLHQSRVETLSQEGAADCWLERWRSNAIETGARALGSLRDGVKVAIEALGTGFLRHPANSQLREELDSGSLQLDDLHRALLRLVYRLLFLFVAEDRDALLHPAAEATARARYHEFFSTARLRRLSLARRGTRHTDLWQSLSLVIGALGQDEGLPELGLPGLGGLFDDGPLDILSAFGLPNDALLTAVRRLSVVQPRGEARRTVDYRNLGAEELGGIYESLLELVPRYDVEQRSFTLETLAGNERKTSGSYYTPSELIDLVLDEALDPLLNEAEKSDGPAEALLRLTCCDPAVGSGHFLVAAARRIASRLATVRSEELDPTPADMQAAMHDVVANCIYGVDLNPLAAELAKVSLWLEALQPGRPLTFLDAHIKVGNALLGTTPALLAAGIPDEAYNPIEGDDRKAAAGLKKRNKAERESPAQEELFGAGAVDPSNVRLRKRLAEINAASVESLEDAHFAQRRYAEYEESSALRHARLVADAWCAAFVQPKVPGTPAITQAVLDRLAAGDEAPSVNGAQRWSAPPDEIVELIENAARLYRLFHWHLEFPEIFDVPVAGSGTSTGWVGGFSCVVGNPPWEKVKIQEKEFFATRSVAIANAPNAAARKRLIAALPDTDPQLAADWLGAKREAEGESHLLRDSGRYPLCGVGDVNTYSVFAEHFRATTSPAGRMGMITPTGLATDTTTAAYFADALRSRRLAAFYDFENEAKIFAGVHHAYRFAVTCLTGGTPVGEARLAFVVRNIADVSARRFALTPDEILLLNPNTGTLPLFKTMTDAEITLGIYRRHPVLIRDDRPPQNAWGLEFLRMFDMAGDSEIFETADSLASMGAMFDGLAWNRDNDEWLPLYEAKMLNHFDHRYSTYRDATEAQLRLQTLPRLTDAHHEDPSLEALPRYWVHRSHVEQKLASRWEAAWLIGWRKITGQEKWRTFVPCVLPRAGVGDAFPLAFLARPADVVPLQAVWSSFAFDYIARQKLSGNNMTYGPVAQLACPAPQVFDRAVSWDGSVSCVQWLLPRVLELSYTSWRLAPYARDLGETGPPFRWMTARRELLRAELDAAVFHIYGLERQAIDHILDTFPVVRSRDETTFGDYRTKRLILEAYDMLATAAVTGATYVSSLDPPPGHGPRHPERSHV